MSINTEISEIRFMAEAEVLKKALLAEEEKLTQDNEILTRLTGE